MLLFGLVLSDRPGMAGATRLVTESSELHDGEDPVVVNDCASPSGA